MLEPASGSDAAIGEVLRLEGEVFVPLPPITVKRVKARFGGEKAITAHYGKRRHGGRGRLFASPSVPWRPELVCSGGRRASIPRMQ